MDSDRISTEVKDKIKQQVIDVNKKYNIPGLLIWKDIGLTITQPGGVELSRGFNSLTLPQRTQIMFQLMYTLYVFEKLKISHGDLHTGNIFLVDVEPTELCYIVEGVQYRFTTTKLLKIYDFDQGNISADTDITINGGETIRINRVFNANRRSGGSFDRIYGKGEQFVRKSDLMIFITNGMRLLATNYYSLDFGGGRYPEFTHFMRTMMPGFYKPNALSQVSICDTYTELLKTATPQLIKEFREVFLIPEGEEINIDNMKIGRNICSMQWHFYYIGTLPDYYGCLVKDTTPGGIAKNNTLLIPDTIVLPLINMIHNPFFDALKSTEAIDITRQLVYTIDGKL
jgi:hypothetical protein